MAYSDLVPVGTSLIIGATCFALGTIYGNLPYDLNTLWVKDESGQAFSRSLAHYLVWANTPPYVHHVLHGVIFLGMVGCFIKLYKPKEDSKYFEYGTLGLIVFATVIYLTNLRTGINSCFVGDWGEVDMPTGINVMAASQVMMVVILVGVLVLQGGLYYAEWYDAKLKAAFFAEEARLAGLQSDAKAPIAEAEAEATAEVDAGASTAVKNDKAKKRKSKKQ
ncbi:Secretory component protein SHR3 [Meyerozyma sp. JA9]|nr:Secretory component protein SHR3 [Meyerozyma sp. JA9]